MAADLLPTNATPWERAIADAADGTNQVASAVATVRGAKLIAPAPSFLPFLVYEFGLGELSPYVPNLFDLIAEGIRWQRLRGTPAALSLGLSWIGYQGRLEEEGSQRRFWNLFQVELDRIRDRREDLDRIAGIAQLSAPKRSRFWRGFHGLDLRPLTYGQNGYGQSHYGEYSGVRLKPGGPLWSFGRVHEVMHQLSQADLEAAGAWIIPQDQSVSDFGIDLLPFEEPAVEWIDDPPAAVLGWGPITWRQTASTWRGNAELARQQAMASYLLDRQLWVVFLDAANQPIGYRRTRGQRFVQLKVGGHYQFKGQAYAVQDVPGTSIFTECQTGFGNGVGKLVSAVALVIGGEPNAGLPRGTQWLAPSQIINQSAPFARRAMSFRLGESIRERVKFLLQLQG